MVLLGFNMGKSDDGDIGKSLGTYNILSLGCLMSK